jgi:hypothetical protein
MRNGILERSPSGTWEGSFEVVNSILIKRRRRRQQERGPELESIHTCNAPVRSMEFPGYIIWVSTGAIRGLRVVGTVVIYVSCRKEDQDLIDEFDDDYKTYTKRVPE